jgi:hypothetical protein
MVWTDLLDSTAMKQDFQGEYICDLDQTYLSQILQPRRARVESSLAQFRGRIIKTEGDATTLLFRGRSGSKNCYLCAGMYELKHAFGDGSTSTSLGVPQVIEFKTSNFSI